MAKEQNRPLCEPDRLWGREDVARYLDCTARYVDQIRHKLPEPHCHVGRMPRWKPEQIRNWKGTRHVETQAAA